jgi:flavin-dependent dehydrogenase
MTDAADRASVVILGGGPAGLAAALVLRRERPDLSVVVLERSGYDRPRIGETLPPTVRPLLERIGAWAAFLADGHQPCYAAASAWGSDRLAPNEFFDHPHNRGWHLDRRRFDETLARLAADCGICFLCPARLLSAEPIHDGWRLTYQPANLRSRTLDAGFVVDATGRRAVFARARGAKRIALDRLLGVVVFARVAQQTDYGGTLVEAVPDGWWYSAGLPGGGLVIAFMTDEDIARRKGLKSPDRWMAEAARTRYVLPRLATAEPTGRPVVVSASSSCLDRFGGDRWLAAGDAASTFDPVSSHGVFKALRSGILASYAVRNQFDGHGRWLEKYTLLHTREYDEYRKTWSEVYRQEARWPDMLFWQRRGCGNEGDEQ